MTKASIEAEHWTDGNEAIHAQIERSRPWAGTVFRKNHDGTEADALIAMVFARTAEEAADLARHVAHVHNVARARKEP